VVVAEKLDVTSTEQTGQLKQIHTLANSSMTEAMERELSSHKTSLVSLTELVEVKKAGGKEPSAATEEQISVLRETISELEAKLEDRLKQTERADAQAAEATK
jgi:hypothetical protein